MIDRSRITARLNNRGNQVLAHYSIWTLNGFEYWYTVIESLASDSDMIRLANPLLERLEASTLPQAEIAQLRSGGIELTLCDLFCVPRYLLRARPYAIQGSEVTGGSARR